MFNRITASVITGAVAMVAVAVVMMSAACGGVRKTESKAGETKAAQAEEVANVETAATAETETQAETNTAAQTNETFTDPRDNQTYRTVRIGNRTWFAQNLNYQAEGSECHGDDDSNCARYGRLYALGGESSWKACPAEWRLPDTADWNDLFRAVGGVYQRGKGVYDDEGNFFGDLWIGTGKKLKSKSGWNDNGNGTDEFGFSALPADGSSTGGNVGEIGSWWSATPIGEDGDIIYFEMKWDSDHVHKRAAEQHFPISMRCVRN